MISIVNASKSLCSEIRQISRREVCRHLVKPRNAVLFLTYRCTSRCNTCTIWQREVNQQDELSLEDWQKFIDMIASTGIENVELFGGDVFLRKDVTIPLARYVKSKGIRTEIATNGHLLDWEMATGIVDAGVDCVYVSVDGVGKIHDEVRGVEGNFDRVETALQHLVSARGRKKNPRIVCNCTISSLNVEHFEEVLSFASKVGADSADFEYVGEINPESLAESAIDGLIPTPYYVPQGRSLLLNEEQAVLLKHKLESIKALSEPLDIEVTTINIDTLTIDNIVTGIFPNKVCYMCKSLVTVDPSGNIMACPFFNNYYLGNFKEQPFDSIWNNERHIRFRKCQGQKKIAMCEYCILSVQRNPTAYQSLVRTYYSITRKAKAASLAL